MSRRPAVALLVAAGRGERLGSDGPKAFVRCAGRPLVEWSIEALTASPDIDHVVVALPPGVNAPHGTTGVIGGAVRSASVRAALRAAPAGDLVLVHDAARPLLTPQIVQDCLDAMDEDCDAAIAAAPVVDTIKEGEGEIVTRTLDRSRLWAVQTPQVFTREILVRALDQGQGALDAATDDASLVERLGGTVRLVPCSRDNIKVTTPEDLKLAELLLRARGQ